jgi:hypothetical protein
MALLGHRSAQADAVLQHLPSAATPCVDLRRLLAVTNDRRSVLANAGLSA